MNDLTSSAESRVGDVTPARTVVGTRKGRRSRVGTPLPERMARMTDVNPDGCWLWTGAVAGKGYGVINIAGRLTKAHRVSYELHVGNTLRGEGPAGRAATEARTHCPQGHPYDDTHVDRGARFCRRCKNDYSNRWYARRRAAAKEAS